MSAPLTEPENVKLLYIPKFKGRLVSGLSSKELMIRSLELNIGNPRHAEAALVFQSEGATHISPQETISVPHLIKKTGGKVEALLFTVTREALRVHIDEFEKFQADLDCISSNGLAIVSYIRWKAPSLSDAFLVDLGSSEWTCAFMEGGELKKSHAFGSGTEGLLAALWEDRKKILLPQEIEGVAKQIDLQQIKPNLNPHFSAKLFEMRQELGKTIFSYHRISNKKPIVFTGHVDAFGHLRDFLIESFKETISKEYDEGLDLDERRYAIPIGLAIEQTGRPLQLLSQEFFPKKNWRRAGTYALLLLIASIALSSLFLYAGLEALAVRNQNVIESLSPLLEHWDPQLKTAVLQDQEAALDRWTSDVAAYSKEYPYILDVPRAAEVLTWLGEHPLLQECKSEKDPFEILDLSYQLVEYPKIGSLQTRYRAKVDLHFKVKSPMNARRFHEALLKGDSLVDSTGEISWEAFSDGYRASFFLKQVKNAYVP